MTQTNAQVINSYLLDFLGYNKKDNNDTNTTSYTFSLSILCKIN